MCDFATIYFFEESNAFLKSLADILNSVAFCEAWLYVFILISGSYS